jgi:hypothetical protein
MCMNEWNAESQKVSFKRCCLVSILTGVILVMKT